MIAAKEKTFSTVPDSTGSRSSSYGSIHAAATASPNTNERSKKHQPTTIPERSSPVNRITNYDFLARKFCKPHYAVSEKIRPIVPIENHQPTRKNTRSKRLANRELQWTPEMSQYRGYFVPGAADPDGSYRRGPDRIYPKDFIGPIPEGSSYGDRCKITIYGGHNFSLPPMIEKDYPKNPDGSFNFPPTDCIVGLGCGSTVDVDRDGETDSQQDFLEKEYPGNSIHATYLTKFDSPIDGLKVDKACAAMKSVWSSAIRSAKKMCKGKPANGRVCDSFEETCYEVTVQIKCDEDMEKLFVNGIWKGEKVPKSIGKNCKKYCGRTRVINCNSVK